MNVEFTEPEGRALLEMLDVACKAGGLRYAKVADSWAQKIVDAKARDEAIKAKIAE